MTLKPPAPGSLLPPFHPESPAPCRPPEQRSLEASVLPWSLGCGGVGSAPCGAVLLLAA